MDHNQQGRRGGHSHSRGRRGSDRVGPERRQPPPVEHPNRGDRVDVEQIMRDIRARISQRSGIDLSNQQIQELAARRLEAILDPRVLKPGLLDQLRRGAGERQAPPEAAPAVPPLFEEVHLYDSPSGLLRFFRKLLNPILRLFFNPTPIAHALAVQGRLNSDAATRETERERRQAEWNALHYEILQRLVTDVARVSLEAQSLSLRVESLGARVDFNDRRVRTFEGTQVRAPRPQETTAAPPPQPSAAAAAPPEPIAVQPATDGQQGQPAQPGQLQPGDAPRRRRRRRRGRRGMGTGTGAPAAETAAGAPASPSVSDTESEGETDEGFDDEPSAEEAMTNGDETSASGAVSHDDRPPRIPEE
jgi:hypothetical protein